ncbi:hybrid sensor histidine kinase/response regulator [Mucilaginibacter sp. Bleaf8]|uniref:hybrid sensor histidine kinase/response regulator n=1 Tax=Mucilaginibacter sp. Bleaf8 TaxID=2834430 RepID=UPI001BCCAEB6|nr:hybrid sensor histidine kinase/response regulator [Mucilaginibacter sp. Bleaf8]MBS7562990.1 hybrid sensor histidine kinase/response regulator [Mucilaginibacter sp. Bleaf8]
MNELNTAVLVIDDEEMVRDNIEDILVPQHQSEEQSYIDSAMDILFDTQKPLLTRTRNFPSFTVEKASNGMEGVKKVQQAVQSGKPYAVIFLDMRMPGWSGLETAMEIRKYDVKAEIIFITAYSDRSIDDIVEQAGQNVGYHCKPYAPEEIIQLATKAVTDYNRLRNLERLIESISNIGWKRNQLDSLLKNILDQLAGSIDTDMALIGKLHDNFTYEKVLSIGALEEKVNLSELINRVKNTPIGNNEVVQIDELVLARLDSYSVFAILKKQERLKTEKMYLLKLFVQNAAQAIRNAELNEKLMQQEKLSAVGQVIGMVMHDLRTPIKNIRLITDLVREEGNGSELIDLIDRSAEQASEIFDDFLDFIKDTPVHKSPVNLLAAVNEAVKMAEGREGVESISIHIDIPETLTIAADESKLRRAISNLVNNSIDALYNYSVPNAQVAIKAEVNDNKALLTIRDNGPGIPRDIIKTLFEPFVTKHKSNGTGLGLAIVKQYITAHGGNIEVSNDSGAVFTITLPID